MGEDDKTKEVYEMLEAVKDKKFIQRICGIIKLQLEKENEESNIIN